MAAYSGRDGVIELSGNTIAEVKDFSITETSNTTPRTVLGDEYERVEPTTKAWSGSVNVFYDPTDSTGQALMSAGSKVSLTLYPVGDTSGLMELSGTVLINDFNVNTSNESLVEASFSFEGDGTLTKTLVA
jgi:hypothetical protein